MQKKVLSYFCIMNDDMTFSLAPVQGVTDAAFRAAWRNVFRGIAQFYIPFVNVNSEVLSEDKVWKELLPEFNQCTNTVPQMLGNRPDAMLHFVRVVADMGYTEVNWNIGCPHRPLAIRKLGSGLLPYPDFLKEILDVLFSSSTIPISVKMRTGYNNADEIMRVLPVLNQFPVKKIIIHPRTGRQMYKGVADEQAFARCKQYSKHPLEYNGDIVSSEKFESLQKLFPDIHHWMLGRGVLNNPFLPDILFNRQNKTVGEMRNMLLLFHHELIAQHLKLQHDENLTLSRIISLWSYQMNLFEEPHVIWRKIKKSKHLNELNAAVKYAVNNCTIVNSSYPDRA